MNSDMKKLKSGMFWKTISTGFNVLQGFVMSVIFVRFLGKDSYGELILVYAVIALFILCSNFGLDAALRRFIPLYKNKIDEKKFARFILTSIGLGGFFTILFSIVMFLLADFVSSNIFHKPSLGIYMRWGSAYLFTLSLLSNIVFSIYYGFQKWKEECLLNGIYLFISFLSVFTILSIFNAGIVGILKINAIVCFLAALTGMFYVARFIKLVNIQSNFREFASQINETLNFSAPLFVNTLLFYFVMQFDKIILGIHRPMEELTQYYLALAIGTGIMMFIKVTEVVFTPYLVKFTDESNTVIKSKFQTIFRMFLHSSIILSIFLYFLIDPFIRFVYGPDFGIAASAFKIYLIVIVMRSAITSVGLFLVNVFGKTLEITKIGVVSSLIHLALFLILIPIYGYKGALATLIIAYMTIWAYVIIFIKEIRRIIPYKSLTRAAAGMALVLGINFAFRLFNVYNQWILFVILPLTYGLFVLLMDEIKLKNIKDAI